MRLTIFFFSIICKFINAQHTRTVCNSQSACQSIYENKIKLSDWPINGKINLNDILNQTILLFFPIESSNIEFDFYLQQYVISGIQPDQPYGISIIFPTNSTKLAISKWLSIWKLKNSESSTRLIKPFIIDSSKLFPLSLKRPNATRAIFFEHEQNVGAIIQLLLKNFKWSLESYNARLNLSQLRVKHFQSLHIHLIKEKKECDIQMNIKAVSTQFVSDKFDYTESLKLANVTLKKRNLIGSGQHRILNTILDVSNIVNNCTLDIIEYFPSNVYTDLDELFDYKNNDLISKYNPQFISLSFMHIELPSYMTHSTVFIHRYNIENSQELNISIPLHVRYDSPCPSDALYSQSLSVCLENNNYRRFRFGLPIFSLQCDKSNRSNDFQLNIESQKSIPVDHPVGISNHTLLVAVVTTLILFLGSLIIISQVYFK